LGSTISLLSGLTVSATPAAATDCGGSLSAVGGAGTVSLSGGSVASGGSSTMPGTWSAPNDH